MFAFASTFNRARFTYENWQMDLKSYVLTPKKLVDTEASTLSLSNYPFVFCPNQSSLHPEVISLSLSF